MVLVCAASARMRRAWPLWAPHCDAARVDRARGGRGEPKRNTNAVAGEEPEGRSWEERCCRRLRDHPSNNAPRFRAGVNAGSLSARRASAAADDGAARSPPSLCLCALPGASTPSHGLDFAARPSVRPCVLHRRGESGIAVGDPDGSRRPCWVSFFSHGDGSGAAAAAAAAASADCCSSAGGGVEERPRAASRRPCDGRAAYRASAGVRAAPDSRVSMCDRVSMYEYATAY